MFANTCQIETSPHLGRYVTSLKNFEQGDIVWEEDPLIFTPSEIANRQRLDSVHYSCLGCCKKITDAEMKCPRCQWPCCSVVCSQMPCHKNFECKIFARRSIQVFADSYRSIVFVRFAMFKTLEPEKYKSLLELCCEYGYLDVHMQLAVNSAVESLTDFLKAQCYLDVSRSEVLKMFTIFQTNNFQFMSFGGFPISQFLGRAVYKYSSLLSHSCSHNMEYTFYKVVSGNGNSEWKIRMHARQAIKIGQILSVSYGVGRFVVGTVPRQLQILEEHHFICRCSRCNDPTEEGTYLSAVICPTCRKGNLLPVDPIATTSPWKCDSCPVEKSADFVEDLIRELRVVPMNLANITEDTMTKADNYIEMNSGTILHSHHYFVFQCALRWLSKGFFQYFLLETSDETRKLFEKIMKRIHRYLPIAEKFEGTSVNANLRFLVAQVLAAYVFKSVDMKEIEEGQLLPRDKIKTSQQIVDNLKSSLVWYRMQPEGVNFELEVEMITEFIKIWSNWLEVFTDQSTHLEENTLGDISNMFI